MLKEIVPWKLVPWEINTIKHLKMENPERWAFSMKNYLSCDEEIDMEFILSPVDQTGYWWVYHLWRTGKRY